MGPQWLGTFVQGMATMACIVIALFFLQFWRKTADRLFLIFAVAFCLMCVTRVVSTSLVSAAVASGAAEANVLAAEHNSAVYIIRFVAYMLIVGAIVDKNR
jgi:hypothetical protein